jgi:tetratricopeptide (TPR) repeat protein
VDDLMVLKLDEALKLAKKKLKEGSSEDAKPIYQDILRRFPANKKAKIGLKALSGSPVGKDQKVLNPPQDQQQILISFYSQGQLQQALEQAKGLLEQFPYSILSHNICGAVYAAFNQYDAAINSYKQALKIKPDYADAHNNMGVVLLEIGELNAAIDSYKQALKIKPNYAEAHYNMGNALKEKGELNATIDSYEQALKIKPDYADAHNNMGVVLLEIGELNAAIDSYKQALKIKPDYAEAHYNMGNALKEKGELNATIDSYEQALKIKPDYADAHNNMGTALQDHGKLEEAIEAYNKALAIKPDHAETHRHLSGLTKYALDDEHFAQCQSLYQDESLSDKDRCHLSFALAKMYEDTGKLDEAYAHLTEGNTLRKKRLNYLIDQDERVFAQLKKTQPKIMQHSLNPAHHAAAIVPIFILGMPRSGTTLIEQIVSSHSKVTGAGELNYVSQFGSSLAQEIDVMNVATIPKFRERYLSEITKKADGSEFVTDKMPDNFKYIALICAAFPEAKIIHVQRESAATCWSNFKHYFTSKGLGYSYNLADIVSYYTLYMDLIEFWQQIYNNRIYNLDYDKLTENQEPETQRLIEHLGLSWEDACLAPQNNKRAVKTASQQQVRLKLYKGSSQAWRKYEPFLEGVFDSLKAL